MICVFSLTNFLGIYHYYGMDVYAFQNLMLKPQCGGIWRWGLREVIRVGWGHDGVAPMVGLVPLWEETPESLFSLPLPHSLFLSSPHPPPPPYLVRTQGEDSSLLARKRALTRTRPCRHPDLGLPASELWEINVVNKPPSQSTVFCCSSPKGLRHSPS